VFLLSLFRSVNAFLESQQRQMSLIALLTLFLEYNPSLDVPGEVLTRMRRSRLLTNSMYHVGGSYQCVYMCVCVCN
jgi:hypothetical protein